MRVRERAAFQTHCYWYAVCWKANSITKLNRSEYYNCNCMYVTIYFQYKMQLNTQNTGIFT